MIYKIGITELFPSVNNNEFIKNLFKNAFSKMIIVKQ